MISSPRLFALATLLAPVILFLVVHTAHGATRPAVRFTSAPAAVTAARSATLAIARSVPHGGCARRPAGSIAQRGSPAPDVRRARPGGRPARRRCGWCCEAGDGDGDGGLAGGHGRALGAAGAGRWREWTALPARTVTHGTARPRPGVRSGVVPLADLDRRRRDLGAGPAGDVTVTAEGETLVQFAAVDRAGNASPWSSSAVVRLDRTAPAVPTVSAPRRWTDAAAVQLSIAGSEAVEHQRSTDGGASLGRVRIRHPGRRDRGGRDASSAPALATQAGNCSAVVGAPTVRIDRTAPSRSAAGVSGRRWRRSRAASIR